MTCNDVACGSENLCVSWIPRESFCKFRAAQKPEDVRTSCPRVQHVIESCFCQEMAVLEKKVPTADWNGMKFVIDFQHVESVTIRKFCISTQGRIMELSTYLDRFCNQSYMSHEKKPSYFPLYWLVNRDPYVMVYYNPYIIG